MLELFPENKSLARWIQKAEKHVKWQACRPRVLAGPRREAEVRLHINKMVRDGLLKGPIVIGRDHLDTGSVASPYRETEGKKDGSDAIADWPISML